MKKPFKDPIGVKSKKMSGGPWSFAAPSLDNRNSIMCGDDYGIGHRTPVGKQKAANVESGPLAYKSKCFSPNEVFHGDVEG